MGWHPNASLNDVRLLEQDTQFKGHFTLVQIHLQFKQFNGKWSPVIVREQIQRAHAVAALLVDLRAQKIVLVEQLRVGAIEATKGHSPWLLEVVAGLLDAGETPEQAIGREVQEETGCSIEHLHWIGQFFTSPGGLQEQTTLFCAFVDVRHVKAFAGSASENEDIKCHCMEMTRALELLPNGLMTSSSTMIALQWLALNHKRLAQIRHA